MSSKLGDVRGYHLLSEMGRVATMEPRHANAAPPAQRLASLALACVLLLPNGVSSAEDAPATVQIKKWKVDPVDLLDQPDGKVVASKPAAELPAQATRAGQGWLKVTVGGQDYYVEASQARTDLKLTGKPKCEQLEGATAHAASRGIGEEGCEK
jgi:hypothetical protein